VIGIFESGISGYDEVLAFLDYRLLQKIYRMQNKITGLGVRIADPENAPDIADELAELSEEYIVGNWADENKSIFQVMKIEKIGLFLILSLIIVVAAFQHHQFADYAGTGEIQGNCDPQSTRRKRFRYTEDFLFSGISDWFAGNDRWSFGGTRNLLDLNEL